MNRFVIVDGLPYLFSCGKTYAVRWDADGFTVGAEVKLASVPEVTYSELSILAKCHEHLDSIGAAEPEEKEEAEPEEKEEAKPEEKEEAKPEEKKKAGRKKTAKAVNDDGSDG